MEKGTESDSDQVAVVVPNEIGTSLKAIGRSLEQTQVESPIQNPKSQIQNHKPPAAATELLQNPVMGNGLAGFLCESLTKVLHQHDVTLHPVGLWVQDPVSVGRYR